MWFWLCILALCSLVDYITWAFRIIIPYDKLRFVKRHLDIEAYLYGSSSKRRGSGQQQRRTTIMEGKSGSAAGLVHRGSRHSTSKECEYSPSSKDPNRRHSSSSPQPQPSVPQAPGYLDIEREKRLLREFTFSYLKDDGIFALRIMASSASDLIVTEIMSELWKNFKLNYENSCSDEVSTLVSSPSSSSQSSSSNSSPNVVL